MPYKRPTKLHLKIALGAVCAVGVAGLVAIGVAQVAQPSLADMIEEAQKKADATAKTLDGVQLPADDKMRIYQEQAKQLTDENHSRIQHGLTYLGQGYDANTLETAQDQDTKNGVVYVAVSLTMPRESLKELVADAHKAHVQVVIQGPPHGSFKELFQQMKDIFPAGEHSGIAMDPRVFRDFRVTEVPTFISAAEPIQNCDQGIDCDRPEPANDKIRGNVHLAYALKEIAKRGDVAPLAAQEALTRLEN